MPKKAILLAPEDNLAVYNLAMCYDFLKEFNDALLWYQRAADLAPRDPDPIYNIAEIYFNDDRIPEAKKLCRKALVLCEQLYNDTQSMPFSLEDPSTTDRQLADISYRASLVFYLLAMIEAKDGKLVEALESIHEATRIDSRNAWWFMLMAQIYHALGYSKEAEEARSRAIELDSSFENITSYKNEDLNLN